MSSPIESSAPRCRKAEVNSKPDTHTSDSVSVHEAKMLRWTRVNSIAAVFTAIATLLAVGFALWAVRVYEQQRDVYREQRDLAKQQLDDLKDSIRENASSTV
jgi:cell division protein FtsL